MRSRPVSPGLTWSRPVSPGLTCGVGLAPVTVSPGLTYGSACKSWSYIRSPQARASCACTIKLTSPGKHNILHCTCVSGWATAGLGVEFSPANQSL